MIRIHVSEVNPDISIRGGPQVLLENKIGFSKQIKRYGGIYNSKQKLQKMVIY
jgi:hypothetical protein